MNCAPADHTPSSEPALARARRVCFPCCAWEAGSHGRQSDHGSGVLWRSDLRSNGQALHKLLLHAAWDRNPAGQQTVDPDLLTAPFTLAEAKTAIAGMNKNSAPGPDGFCSAFYRAPWNHITPRIEHLLAFYDNNVNSTRIIRAHIILLAKKHVVITPTPRPISLQNLSVKLVALDQTGFF